MEENNHTYIDLLKLDIEGAEINLLNKMLDDKIYPTYVLCEFDLLLKNKDINQDTKHECRDSKSTIKPGKFETTQRPNSARDFY